MDVTISSEMLARIVGEAAASPGVEVCGLLLGHDDRIQEARSCRNVAADPARTFEIDPVALLAAHRAARKGGPAILGCYHSHPTGIGVPSACDADSAMGDGAVWLITAGDEIRAWRTVERGVFVEVRLIVAN